MGLLRSAIRQVGASPRPGGLKGCARSFVTSVGPSAGDWKFTPCASRPISPVEKSGMPPAAGVVGAKTEAAPKRRAAAPLHPNACHAALRITFLLPSEVRLLSLRQRIEIEVEIVEIAFGAGGFAHLADFHPLINLLRLPGRGEGARIFDGQRDLDPRFSVHQSE